MKKPFIQDIEEKSARFVACRDIDDICRLGFNKNELLLQSLNISYHAFELRKANGKMRLIEAPPDTLKAILRQFNFYLQCIYYLRQSTAAYGYIITPKHDKAKKNILENARLHLKNGFMLNVDFQDFFHQISCEQLVKLFTTPPFQFDKPAAQFLAKLFTYKGRLPMGAPTSPVLSNFCTLQLDDTLTNWAQNLTITYSRFVDDLSFSNPHFDFMPQHFEEINTICQQHGYLINPAKVKYYGKDAIKKVTGLILRDTVDIDDSFYQQLNQDLTRMKSLVEVVLINHGLKSNEEVQTFKKEIEGQINFIGMIEGFDSPLFYQYRQKLKNAMNPPEEVLSVRWTNFNYL